jgi:hypothetical protein
MIDTSIIKRGIMPNRDGGFDLPEFVNIIQGFCLGLRLTHWETTSYELHKAVESTQAALEGLMDDFVEACVGMNSGKRPTFGGVVSKDTDEDNIISCLKNLSVKDSSLLNIRDEMLQVIYKFKYLKTLN